MVPGQEAAAQYANILLLLQASFIGQSLGLKQTLIIYRIDMFRGILLQCKFILVAFLNVTYNFFPYPLRKVYLRIFGIKTGKNTSIHRLCRFFHVGNLQVGNNCTINFGCYLDNRRGIYIGNNVGIAHNTKIYTLGHDIDDPEFRTKGKATTIEDNSFIFSNAIIMPGVTIGEGAIVLPGSVVTKNVEAWSIVGGNPAHFIRKRKENIDYRHSYNYLFAL